MRGDNQSMLQQEIIKNISYQLTPEILRHPIMLHIMESFLKGNHKTQTFGNEIDSMIGAILRNIIDFLLRSWPHLRPDLPQQSLCGKLSVNGSWGHNGLPRGRKLRGCGSLPWRWLRHTDRHCRLHRGGILRCSRGFEAGMPQTSDGGSAFGSGRLWPAYGQLIPQFSLSRITSVTTGEAFSHDRAYEVRLNEINIWLRQKIYTSNRKS